MIKDFDMQKVGDDQYVVVDPRTLETLSEPDVYTVVGGICRALNRKGLKKDRVAAILLASHERENGGTPKKKR